jgi:nucleoside-diphosphate-sugar epimerase
LLNQSTLIVADLYVVLLDAARKTPEKVGQGREGYYFGESGSHTLLQVAEAIGAALVKAGKATDPTPTTFTDEEAVKFFGGKWLGSNSLAVAERSRSIGWKPAKTTKDMLASIQPEVDFIIAKQQA